MIWLLLSTVLILGAVLAYLLWVKDYDHWDRKGVPHVKPSFPYGNVKGIFGKKETFGHFFEKMIKRFPDESLIGFHGFFKPMLIVNDPELVKVVLVQDFAKFVENAFKLGSGDRLLSKTSFWIPGHKQWKEARSRFTPTMTSAKLKTMVPIMTETTQRYMELYHSKKLTIQETIKFSLQDTMFRVVFSIEVDLLKAAKEKNSDLGILVQGDVFTNPTDSHLLFCSSFLAPWIHKLQEMRFVSKEMDAFYMKFINGCVKERKRSQIQRDDILQAIVNIEKKDIGAGRPGFTEEEWASNILTVMIDSTETTALVFDLIMHQLALNQSAQDKLRQEIVQAGSTMKDFDYEKISSMKSLELVIYESMRLHSPVQVIGRYAVETTKLGNVVVEKGTPLFISPQCYHLNPKYHPDPMTFKPERFEDASILHNGTFMPFGEGPKACLGQRYAMNIMKVLLVGILTRYRIVKAANYKTPEIDTASPFMLNFVEKPKLELVLV